MMQTEEINIFDLICVLRSVSNLSKGSTCFPKQFAISFAENSPVFF
jgi:hypothetical protein